jgi:hypothetical protein
MKIQAAIVEKWHKGLKMFLKIELLYDSSVPFLDMYPKEMKSLPHKDICILVFIGALFTIAKNGSDQSVSR